MNSRISFLDNDYWAQLESDLLEMTINALILLKNELKDQVEENPINFVLNRCFLKASRSKIRNQYGHLAKARQPDYEAEKISYEDDETRFKRMGKRPDFQWKLYDDSALPDSILYSIVFTIECKRIGDKVNNRDLCKAYIDHGILRFTNKEWSYGSGADSGAMIGYIQSSNEKIILSQINQHITQKSLNKIKPNRKQNGISLLKQNIKRKNIEPKEFSLNHLWVDLI